MLKRSEARGGRAAVREARREKKKKSYAVRKEAYSAAGRRGGSGERGLAGLQPALQPLGLNVAKQNEQQRDLWGEGCGGEG